MRFIYFVVELLLYQVASLCCCVVSTCEIYLEYCTMDLIHIEGDSLHYEVHLLIWKNLFMVPTNLKKKKKTGKIPLFNKTQKNSGSFLKIYRNSGQS